MSLDTTARAMADTHPRLALLARSKSTLAEYQNAVSRKISAHPPSKESKRLLSRVVFDLCDGFKEFSEQREHFSARSFSVPDAISFAEHHASITHPETTNVVANLACFSGGRHARVVTLSCGTTPLDNALFPRGVIVGASSVALTSNRHRRMCVICAPPLDVVDARARLESALRSGTMDEASSAPILAWFDGLMPALRRRPTFWQQVTIINASLGESMFQGGGIEYISVPIELVATKLLSRWLSTGEDNWLTRSMVNAAAFEEFVGAFDGVAGLFDRAQGRGTVMAWRSVRGRLSPIGLEGDALPYSRSEWVEYLNRGDLVPSAGMSMLAVAFVLGFPNFGGLLQYDYLAQARSRLLGSHIAMTDDERATVMGLPDSFYVDFERRPATDGGLLRLLDPIKWKELETDMRLPLAEHVRDCLRWVIDSQKGK